MSTFLDAGSCFSSFVFLSWQWTCVCIFKQENEKSSIIGETVCILRDFELLFQHALRLLGPLVTLNKWGLGVLHHRKPESALSGSLETSRPSSRYSVDFACSVLGKPDRGTNSLLCRPSPNSVLGWDSKFALCVICLLPFKIILVEHLKCSVLNIKHYLSMSLIPWNTWPSSKFSLFEIRNVTKWCLCTGQESDTSRSLPS